MKPDLVVENLEAVIFGFLDNLEEMVKRFGIWLSLVVIIIKITKLLITITMVSITLTQQGIAGCKAVLLQLCCTKIATTQIAIQREQKRKRKRMATTDIEMGDIETRRANQGSSTNEVGL